MTPEQEAEAMMEHYAIWLERKRREDQKLVVSILKAWGFAK